MTTQREQNGRFTHEWGWQGYSADGQEWADCSHCGKWRSSSGQTTKKDPGELRPSTRAWAVAK